MKLCPSNGDLQILLDKITAPPAAVEAAAEPTEGEAAEGQAGDAESPAAPATQMPTCGISQ